MFSRFFYALPALSDFGGEVKDGLDGTPRFAADWWLRRKGDRRVVVHHDRPCLEHDNEERVMHLKDDTLFSGLVPCTPKEHDELHKES